MIAGPTLPTKAPRIAIAATRNAVERPSQIATATADGPDIIEGEQAQEGG